MGGRRPGGEDGPSSQHPTDRLIRELIGTKRAATAAEIAQIRGRMATAAFSREIRRVPRKDRGYSYQGHVLGAHADSLTYHLTKRVVIEEQWAHGTSIPEGARWLQ